MVSFVDAFDVPAINETNMPKCTGLRSLLFCGHYFHTERLHGMIETRIKKLEAVTKAVYLSDVGNYALPPCPVLPFRIKGAIHVAASSLGTCNVTAGNGLTPVLVPLVV